MTARPRSQSTRHWRRRERPDMSLPPQAFREVQKMPLYHVSAAQLSAGQVLQPGAWGRTTRQFRKNGRALTDVGDAKILAWESCLETARRMLAPKAPSRLDCVFTCETL